MNEQLFHKIAKECADLVTKKNKAYGNSFERAGEILKILFPNGVGVDQYQDMLTVTRVLDKLFRICSGDKKAFEENPWRDVLGYSLLSVCSEEKTEDEKTEYKFNIGDHVCDICNKKITGIVLHHTDTDTVYIEFDDPENISYSNGEYGTANFELIKEKE